MKIPNLHRLVNEFKEYKNITDKELIFLVDSTFSPNSQIIKRVYDIDPNLSVIVFNSLSKSISGGRVTGGSLVPNYTHLAQNIVKECHSISELFDTTVKTDQLHILIDKHKGVEDRVNLAYQNAKLGKKCLETAIHKYTGIEDMKIHFVTDEQAEYDLKPATFSFNLPVSHLTNTSDYFIKHLAQHFVDLLCENSVFKPCVSFGQEVPLVYATVPATSTQGDIRDEDKEKQSIGNVQLVRLSFSHNVNMADVNIAIKNAIKSVYKKNE
jgi:cysteine synthase A